MDSYRLIGTYSTDSSNLNTWGGPASSAAFDAPGTSTAWGSEFQASAFNAGGTFAAVPHDVLNTKSGLGSDELDLSSLLSSLGSSGYSVSNAAVFNWNGNSSTPGFGCDTFSITGGNLIDTLAAPDWGLVRDYELSINPTDAANISEILVTNFQDTNLQYWGPSGVFAGVYGAQRGTFDMSHAATSSGQIVFGLAPVAPKGTTSQSTFVYMSSVAGDNLDVGVAHGPGGPVATVDPSGKLLITDGSTSLLDYYGNTAVGSGDIIDLEDNIASNIFVKADTGATGMSFLTTGQGGFDAGWTSIYLNPSSTQAAHVTVQSLLSDTIIESFQTSRDSLDMVTGAGWSASYYQLAGSDLVAIADPTHTYGVVLTDMTPDTFAAHVTEASVGGVQHLYVTPSG